MTDWKKRQEEEKAITVKLIKANMKDRSEESYTVHRLAEKLNELIGQGKGDWFVAYPGKAGDIFVDCVEEDEDIDDFKSIILHEECMAKENAVSRYKKVRAALRDGESLAQEFANEVQELRRKVADLEEQRSCLEHDLRVKETSKEAALQTKQDVIWSIAEVVMDEGSYEDVKKNPLQVLRSVQRMKDRLREIELKHICIPLSTLNNIKVSQAAGHTSGWLSVELSAFVTRGVAELLGNLQKAQAGPQTMAITVAEYSALQMQVKDLEKDLDRYQRINQELEEQGRHCLMLPLGYLYEWQSQSVTGQPGKKAIHAKMIVPDNVVKFIRSKRPDWEVIKDRWVYEFDRKEEKGLFMESWLVMRAALMEDDPEFVETILTALMSRVGEKRFNEFIAQTDDVLKRKVEVR